jgi:hypothetical protein
MSIFNRLLRDYFAAKAMQAYISNPEIRDKLEKVANRESSTAHQMIAIASYGAADAMLKQRHEK